MAEPYLKPEIVFAKGKVLNFITSDGTLIVKFNNESKINIFVSFDYNPKIARSYMYTCHENLKSIYLCTLYTFPYF